MLPVEVLAAPGGNLVLRARGSELLIITSHVAELRTRKEPKEFTNYFMGEALINRPARKLFEAWLRKDKGLWRRIYDTIQTQITDADIAGSETPEPKAKAKVEKEKPAEKAAKKAEPVEAKAAKKPAAKKEEEPKAKAKPAEAKPAAKKADTKPAAKEKAAPAKKEAPKKAAAAKKPAAKAAASKAKPAAKKK